MYGPEINNDECTADVGPFGFMGCTTKGCSCEIKQAKHESTIRDLNTPNFKTRAKHESMRAIGWLSPEEITAVVEKNLQAYREALAEANETTRIWKKRYNDLSAHINSINTQNAELVAQVEQLLAACSLGIDMFIANDINVPNTIETMQDAIDATPTQCLRQIKADAGRAGFVAGLYYPDKVRIEGATRNPVFAADEYAARVRAGEV